MWSWELSACNIIQRARFTPGPHDTSTPVTHSDLEGVVATNHLPSLLFSKLSIPKTLSGSSG